MKIQWGKIGFLETHHLLQPAFLDKSRMHRMLAVGIVVRLRSETHRDPIIMIELEADLPADREILHARNAGEIGCCAKKFAFGW